MRMLRAIQGGGVLLLLSVFVAYMLARVDAGLRSRVRIGRRKRPLPHAVSLTLLYAVLFFAGTLGWRLAGDRMTRWVGETAPAAVDQLFRGAVRGVARGGAGPGISPPHGCAWFPALGAPCSAARPSSMAGRGISARRQQRARRLRACAGGRRRHRRSGVRR